MCPIVTFYYVYACIWLLALCFENPNRLKSLSNCADPNSKAGFILVFEMPEIRRTYLNAVQWRFFLKEFSSRCLVCNMYCKKALMFSFKHIFQIFSIENYYLLCLQANRFYPVQNHFKSFCLQKRVGHAQNVKRMFLFCLFH